MNTENVIKRLRELKTEYVRDEIWKQPDRLATHLAEFLGYATILYSHCSEFMVRYRETEAKTLIDETHEMKELNNGLTPRHPDRRTSDEKKDRITIRMSKIKGHREQLELELKAATIHINGIQSLLKRAGDEAKGFN